TLEMYDHIKQAIEQGLNVGFLSANSVKWVIDLKPGVGDVFAGNDRRTGLTPQGKEFRQSLKRRIFLSGQFSGWAALEDCRKRKKPGLIMRGHFRWRDPMKVC